MSSNEPEPPGRADAPSATVVASGEIDEHRQASGPVRVRCVPPRITCPHCDHDVAPGALLTATDDEFHLELRLRIEADVSTLAEQVRVLRRTLIRWALSESEGVRSSAARLLGLKYSTFWQMADRLGVLDEPLDEPTLEIRDGRPRRPIRLVILETEDPVTGSVRTIRIRRDDDEPLLDKAVGELQRALAGRALDATDGVVRRAADLVGMKYPTFYAMVQRLEVRA